MDYNSWFKNRSPRFIMQRGLSLLKHYGFGIQKSTQRIDALMDCFEQFDCSPTFPVPGQVIENNSSYILSLQDRGAEIAVHGYNHVNLKTYAPKDASSQLIHAVKVFTENGIKVHGFRCPYLSSSDSLLEALPIGVFNYSSNKAVKWDFEKPDNGKFNPIMFKTISSFYMPEAASIKRCLPWVQSNLIEIPVSVPDDLQLKDGMGFSQEDLARSWVKLLNKTYNQAEIFNLMFHPELASYCLYPFVVLLKAAREYTPKIWVAPLFEIAKWWREKSTLSVTIERTIDNSLKVTLPQSSGANWVARGFDFIESSTWIRNYKSLSGNSYILPSNVRPFIGVDKNVPQKLIDSLINQGYIIDQSDLGRNCSIYLDHKSLENYSFEADLVDMIEISSSPLIRLWPWPAKYQSALCITGDLDALSIKDYLNRLKINGNK